MISLISIAHAALSWGLFLILYGKGMERFDTGVPAGLEERVPQALSSLLFLPLVYPLIHLPGDWVHRVFPGLLGYIPIFLNSVLWGLAIWRFLVWWRRNGWAN